MKMTTKPVVFSGLVLVLTCGACGNSEGAAQNRPNTGNTQPNTAPSKFPTPKTVFESAADGTNVKACRDGHCEVVVTKPTEIPLDPRFGFKTLSFDPADIALRYCFREGGCETTDSLSAGSAMSMAAPSGEQSINFKVEAVATDDSKVLVTLTPGS